MFATYLGSVSAPSFVPIRMGSAPRRRARACRNERPSEELFDHVNRPVGANLPGANGEQPVQEGVFRFGSLEARHRTKVGSSWRTIVTDPLERHVNESAVVGLHGEAQVEHDGAVPWMERPNRALRHA